MTALTAYVSARRARAEARRPKSLKEAIVLALFKATYSTATFGVSALVAGHFITPTLVVVQR